jgi:hypothetical protein
MKLGLARCSASWATNTSYITRLVRCSMSWVANAGYSAMPVRHSMREGQLVLLMWPQITSCPAFAREDYQ